MSHPFHGRGAGHRRPALPLLTAAALILSGPLLSGCAVGDGEEPTGAPPAKLSTEGKIGKENRKTRPVGVSKKPRRDSERARPRAKQSAPGTGTAPGSPSTDASPVSGGSATPRSWEPVVSVTDPAADHGRGPTYADLRELTLSKSGDRLRITVVLDGVAPARLADREVQGVGIDFFTGDGKESDHQVFLDGGAHGWRGYLQGPEGFVRFPGALVFDGPVVTVTLPWSSVGGRRGTVSAYVDWSAGTSMLSTDGTERQPID